MDTVSYPVYVCRGFCAILLVHGATENEELAEFDMSQMHALTRLDEHLHVWQVSTSLRRTRQRSAHTCTSGLTRSTLGSVLSS